MELNEKLKKFRLDKGMSQLKLANDIGCQPTRLSKWENGANIGDAYTKIITQYLQEKGIL